MAKFKIGDRVRVLPGRNNPECGVVDGMTGVIMEEDDVPYIKFDQDLPRPVRFNGEWCAPMCESELVSDKPDTAERDQIARDILVHSWSGEMYGPAPRDSYPEEMACLFDLVEAFLAERAKLTKGGADMYDHEQFRREERRLVRAIWVLTGIAACFMLAAFYFYCTGV